MRVVVKHPGEQPVAREVKGDLASFQAIVGGYIEIVARIPLLDVVVYGNEEARLMDPVPPLNLVKADGTPIYGSVVAVLVDLAEGEEESMPEDTARHIIACLQALDPASPLPVDA